MALPPHVVVLGCGYAGGLQARNLDAAAKAGKIRLTVIDRRNSMHHKIGSIRASVQGGEWATRIRIPISQITKYAKTVYGEVAKVDPESKAIIFENPDVTPIMYDILVCATGTLNHSPGDLPDDVVTTEQIDNYFAELSKAFEEASDVLIAGGGASAVEYAGEIRYAYPNKKITMVCSGSNLLSTSVAPVSSSFLKKLYKRLEDLNITLIREEKVIKPTELDFGAKKFERNVTVTTAGKQNLTIKTDLLVWAATWVKESHIYPPMWLNEIGELNISDTFQVLDHPDVLAIGDVSSLCETKQAVTLPAKTKLLSNNILACAAAMAKGENLGHAKAIKHYTVTDRATMYLPIGPKAGVSQYMGWVFGDGKTSQWKGKDLYTNMFWKLLAGNEVGPTPILQ